LPPRAKPT